MKSGSANLVSIGARVFRARRASILTILFSIACPLCAQAQTDADWPTYNHDAAGWRFNPAEKILSPTNVSNLVEKWRFPAAGSRETVGVVHATPAVVAGEVYFGTATFPAFYKLATNGGLRWVYRNPIRKAVLPPLQGEPITEKLRGAASEGCDWKWVRLIPQGLPFTVGSEDSQMSDLVGMVM